MEPEFEFDPTKSATNYDKHGIDFVEAKRLWTVTAFDQPSPFVHEPRHLRTGKLGYRLWTAVYTIRGAAVRLISVRRARPEEIARHDKDLSERTGTDNQP